MGGSAQALPLSRVTYGSICTMPVAVPAGALGLRRHLFLRRLIDRNLRGFGQVLSAEPRTLRSQVRRHCAAMNAMSRLSEATRNAAPTQTAMMLPSAKTNMFWAKARTHSSIPQARVR